MSTLVCPFRALKVFRMSTSARPAAHLVHSGTGRRRASSAAFTMGMNEVRTTAASVLSVLSAILPVALGCFCVLDTGLVRTPPSGASDAVSGCETGTSTMRGSSSSVQSPPP
eukprot:774812-Prymnesium_polylepis.1